MKPLHALFQPNVLYDGAEPPEMLTVRAWFRLLRAEAWRTTWSPVTIYFRQEPQNHDYGPYRTVGIYNAEDVWQIVRAGCVGDPPEKIFAAEIQMRMSTSGRPRESITH